MLIQVLVYMYIKFTKQCVKFPSISKTNWSVHQR